jgi:hypothetical protein
MSTVSAAPFSERLAHERLAAAELRSDVFLSYSGGGDDLHFVDISSSEPPTPTSRSIS